MDMLIVGLVIGFWLGVVTNLVRVEPHGRFGYRVRLDV